MRWACSFFFAVTGRLRTGLLASSDRLGSDLPHQPAKALAAKGASLLGAPENGYSSRVIAQIAILICP